MKIAAPKLLVAALVMGFTTSALADDKVLVLKNGRKVQGEIEDENSSVYTLRTAGGRVTIQRSQVARIEDAPPPEKVLQPAPTAAPAPTPAPSEELPPVKKPPKPTDEQLATPLPKGPGAPGPSGERIGKKEDIEKLRKALFAVPAIDPSDRFSEDMRKEAIEKIAKETPLEALVGLITEIGPYPPPPDRVIALDLVVAAGEKARPLLARSILAVEIKAGLPYEVFTAIQRVGDDEKGSIETAIMTRVREYLRRKETPNVFTNALGTIGTPRILPELYKWLLTPDEYHMNVGVIYPCQAILARSSDPDTELAPLVAKLDAQKLPELYTLAYALKLFEASKGQYVEKLEDLYTGLGLYLPPPDADPDKVAIDLKACFVSLYDALAKIGTREASSLLIKILDRTNEQDRRVAIYRAFGKMKIKGAPSTDMLGALVDHLDKSNVFEQSELVKTLQTLTGQQYGSNVSGWRQFIAVLDKNNPK